jgi:hypothetical protein
VRLANGGPLSVPGARGKPCVLNNAVMGFSPATLAAMKQALLFITRSTAQGIDNSSKSNSGVRLSPLCPVAEADHPRLRSNVPATEPPAIN